MELPKKRWKKANKANKERADYYQFYIDQKCGASLNYNICLNTSYLPLGTAVKKFFEQLQIQSDAVS